MTENAQQFTSEWIDHKQHCLFRKGDRKMAYARSHGDGKRWDLHDAGYRKISEIPAKTREEAISKVNEMALDGSLDQMIENIHDRNVEELRSRVRMSGAFVEEKKYKDAKQAELHPQPSPHDGFLRPSIPMLKETHRLLRAVAARRTKNIPGEQPSIGAIVEELVEKHRPELMKEAGAFYKRELAKKH